jgi:Ser/Thr protein kinase RdoA (MazF antagonist)
VSQAIAVPTAAGGAAGLLDWISLEALLARYGWEGATVTHVGTSENVTFRVVSGQVTSIVRIYRIGHRTHTAIEAELAWMEALRSDAGISTPEVIRALNGDRIHTVPTSAGPTYSVVFRQLSGQEPAESRLTDGFFQLGVLCARMHNHAARWSPPLSIDRPRLGWETLVGARAIWGSWSRAPGLDPRATPVLERVSQQIRGRLEGYGTSARVYGLIHGDLRLQNLLVDDDAVHVIDFDDCSFCWRLYDLATALSLIEDLPLAPTLLDRWLEGYRSRRPLERADLEIVADLIVMRRLQVLGWLGSRSQSELAQQVAPSYVPATVAAAEAYLSGEPRLRWGL